MSKKQLAILGAALLVLLAAGIFSYAGGGNAAAATLPADRVTGEDMVMGSAKAPVTMIEYYAQACSVCAHFDQEVFPLLKAKYIDTGKVRYVMRLFPLFPVDGPSYKLTRCVPPEQYFQAVDVMFRSQPQWDSAEYPGVDARAGLMKMARILGMSDSQALACMNDTQHDAAINKVAQEGEDRYHPPGTPTFVINFKKVEMPEKSWAEAQAAINAALAAKGVK
jgi:protein-disulfide isomerase